MQALSLILNIPLALGVGLKVQLIKCAVKYILLTLSS